MEIFDFHLHPGYDFHGNNTDPEHFVSLLKRDGITGCAGSVVDVDCTYKPLEEYEWRIPDLNRRAWEFHDAYPDFFAPGIHIHPDFMDMSCHEMELHKAKGGVLIGEIVFYMMDFQYNHKNITELLHYAKELDMVVNIHPSKGNPHYVRDMIDSVPGLQVVIAHLDGYGLYEDFISLMQKHENVYADISAYGAERKGMLRDAVNRVGSQRILYGTDFPGAVEDEEQRKYIDYVLAENLDAAATENIFFRNAKRLLRL